MRPRVSAIVPAHNRPKSLARVLDQLAERPVDEIVVVDNGSSVGLAAIAESRGARYIRSDKNQGVHARNLGAVVATGDLLLMLDDDSYPRPGAVSAMRDLFMRTPRLGAVGGKVVDVEENGSAAIRTGEEVGSFDWLARYGARHRGVVEDIPAYFFAEGASMIRRDAYWDVGGCFEPYFGELTELDLATRLIAAGWDVRHLRIAVFDHLRSEEWRGGLRHDLRLRVRNQIWYFWRHFPAPMALRRVAQYLLFDLIECGYRGMIDSWRLGVGDAWRRRELIRGTRRVLPRAVLPRIELNRGRAHAAILWYAARSRAWRPLKSLPLHLYGYITVRIDRWIYDRRFQLPQEASRRIGLDAFGADEPWRGDYLGSPWGVLGRSIKPDEVKTTDVFLDLGCGFGRVVLEAATLPFRRVIGVEVVEHLSDAARIAVRRNQHRLRCPNVEIVTEDVLEFKVPPDVTWIYLYEPFPDSVVEDVVERIVQSVRSEPRDVRIISLSDQDLTRVRHVRSVGFGRRRVLRFLADRTLRIYTIDHR